MGVVALYLERHSHSILWLLLFVPLIFIITLGLETWREIRLGEHYGFWGPKDKIGAQLLGMGQIRLMIMGAGVATTMVVSTWV